MKKNSKESKERLLQIISQAVSQDTALREQLQIGDKFRFIRDRLAALEQQIEEALRDIKVETDETKSLVAENEQLIYIYLFNAHGIDVSSWLRMLHPSVYYDHSVNRPIYGAKEHVEAVIRSKTNRIQHGYLTMVVKKDHIIKQGEQAKKDNLGHPLLKIKEGALQADRLVSFTHNGMDYTLNEDGDLEKIV